MDEDLFAEYELGEEARQFVQSQLGKYLVGCAKQERDVAVQELKTVWPFRKRRIQTLQNVIYRSESFEGWLAELIIRGQTAERLLHEQTDK